LYVVVDMWPIPTVAGDVVNNDNVVTLFLANRRILYHIDYSDIAFFPVDYVTHPKGSLTHIQYYTKYIYYV